MPSSRRHLAVAIITRVVAIVFLLTISFGVYAWLAATAPEPPRAAEDADLPTVVVMRPEAQDVRRQWVGYGIARAMRAADVPARVTSTVRSVPAGILDGAAVTEGQLLVELDDSDFVHQLQISSRQIESIEAQLGQLRTEQVAWAARLELADDAMQLAQREYDRVLEAYQAGAAKDRELDQARAAMINASRDQVAAREFVDGILPRRDGLLAQLEGQRAQQRLAEENVARCRITAPIAGVLAMVDVEEGENVTSGQRIARILNLDRIEVPLRLPAASRPMIRLGDEVQLRSSDNSRAISVPIARISPADDDRTQTIAVFVVVERSSGDETAIAPGEFLSGRVLGAIVHGHQIIPRRAIRNSRVSIVRDERVETVDVRPLFAVEGSFAHFGVDDTQWLVLEDPLASDALLVLDGSRRFASGARVRTSLASERLAGNGTP